MDNTDCDRLCCNFCIGVGVGIPIFSFQRFLLHHESQFARQQICFTLHTHTHTLFLPPITCVVPHAQGFPHLRWIFHLVTGTPMKVACVQCWWGTCKESLLAFAQMVTMWEIQIWFPISLLWQKGVFPPASCFPCQRILSGGLLFELLILFDHATKGMIFLNMAFYEKYNCKYFMHM